jgi:hypothetical protein
VAAASWASDETKEVAHVQAVGFGVGNPDPLLVSVLSSVVSLTTGALAVHLSSRTERARG